MILAIWLDLSGKYKIEYVLQPAVLETSRGILTSFQYNFTSVDRSVNDTKINIYSHMACVYDIQLQIIAANHPILNHRHLHYYRL